MKSFRQTLAIPIYFTEHTEERLTDRKRMASTLPLANLGLREVKLWVSFLELLQSLGNQLLNKVQKLNQRQ